MIMSRLLSFSCFFLITFLSFQFMVELGRENIHFGSNDDGKLTIQSGEKKLFSFSSREEEEN